MPFDINDPYRCVNVAIAANLQGAQTRGPSNQDASRLEPAICAMTDSIASS